MLHDQPKPQPSPSQPRARRDWKTKLLGALRWVSRRLGILLALAVLMAVALAIGIAVGRSGPAESPTSGAHQHAEPAADAPAAATIWTCSMHPQIRLPKPGKCPICFMDLIPLDDSTGGDNPRQLTMSPEAMALAEIRTSKVRRQSVPMEIRMVGKVDYDETRLANISAWVAGRLDRLYVDYTGITVRKGDHLAEIYSPDLVVAQKELIQTANQYQRSTTADAREMIANTLASVQDKLRLMGLLPEQINAIQKSKEPLERVTIHAPVGGVVIAKRANEGDYVQTGAKIYTIADLSLVWVRLDAYESDVPWLRYGQEIRFTTETYPGEVFVGRIAFIDPVLDEATRTVPVRVNVPNRERKLKPGMFVRATAESVVAAAGRVLDPSLAGKWISPMHPEIVKDGPGQCDICGMDLVPAEEMGLVAPSRPDEPPLVIPASAPLITGKRAVVYVKVPGTEKPTFEGREVVLGHRVGDHYMVLDGLEAGEEVVTHGNFKIDSALEIQAGPSMMNPREDTAAADRHGPLAVERKTYTVPGPFRAALAPVYDRYLLLQQALGDDRLGDAARAWTKLQAALAAVDASSLQGEALLDWEAAQRTLDEHLAPAPADDDADAFRSRFEPVAQAVLALADDFGHDRGEPLYRAYCPMAFDNRGAAWLQAGQQIDNPYFGHKMRRCGTVERSFAAGEEGQP